MVPIPRNSWLESITGVDPFVCCMENKYSYLCANKTAAIALFIVACCVWIIRVSKSKLRRVLDDMTNLFGVSIFTVRIFEQIALSMQLNIFEQIWNSLMMYINIMMLKRGVID